MPSSAEPSVDPDRELILTRTIDASREAVFRAWSDPALLAQWWAPFPYTVPHCDIDFRPGGRFRAIMRAANGTEFPHEGVYLDIVPLERIVFTDAFSTAWIPSAKAFMTAVVTFEDEDGMTRYTARALHWSAADRQTHETMGFHEGWGRCAEQLSAVARALRGSP